MSPDVVYAVGYVVGVALGWLILAVSAVGVWLLVRALRSRS